MMKHRCFTVLLLVLALLVAGPAAAQMQQPPLDRLDLAGDQHPTRLPDRSAQLTEPATVPDVALGQPGTAYRYVQTFGQTGMPYLADGQHLNGPNALTIDGNNSLYVVEELGHRLLKYNASGANTLTLGQAGQPWHHAGFLSWPRGAAVDASGNIWVTMNHALKVFDAMGNPILVFPEDEPWNSGTDNSHFNEPRGIAFDGAGRLFVADRYNHRVQVYTVSGTALAYQSTIGVTGQPGSDNTHFRGPTEIAVDPSGRLYVIDVENFRVQRCVYTSAWTCSTFHGTGTAGGGTGQLNWAFGLGIDATGNRIYIGDSANGRVKRCDSTGVCAVLITGLRWPADVAEDSTGTVYVSDYYDFTVRKYSSAGSFLGVFAGASGVPYLTDNSHFNQPIGMAVDPSGNVYLSSERGFRLIKLNKNGVVQWAIGTPGVSGNDNAHFGGFGGGPAGVAVGSNNTVLVADSPNHRVQIYNAQGGYVATLGSHGTGAYQLNWPRGVAVDSSDNIYVADCANHRVQIYDSNQVYLATIGITGSPGSGNDRFRCPHGVAVDTQGNIYVADIDNARVQVFDSQRNYVRTVGVAGQQGDEFGLLSGPAFVATDAHRRLYVGDVWNSRIQVFDAAGAYLTTIGGSYGERTGELRNPMGVAVDAQGNVFIADSENHRIQKYAIGVPGWVQANINGFGDRNNHAAWSLGVFNNRLYASTSNFGFDAGAEVYRLSPAGAWERVATGGFGDASNVGIDRLTEFSGQLYASTWVEDGSGAQIWRSPSGNTSTWSQVAHGGLGSANNSEFMTLTPFGGYLYAGSWVQDSTVHGAEIWRSSTGNSGSWTRVVANGFGDNGNYTLLSMKEFEGYLYASTANAVSGGEIWRSADGVSWSQVAVDGFGSASNSHVVALAAFDGELYAGTENSTRGAEIWRTADGVSWERVLQGGFGNVNNIQIAALVAFRGELVALVGNFSNGAEVWSSPTGESGSWRKVIDGGFGSGRTALVVWDNRSAVLAGSLYIGTYTTGNSGGRLWQYLHNRIYLPILMAQ